MCSFCKPVRLSRPTSGSHEVFLLKRNPKAWQLRMWQAVHFLLQRKLGVQTRKPCIGQQRQQDDT